MNENTNNASAQFTDRIYFVSRVTVLLCLTTFLIVPIALSWIYGYAIDWNTTLRNGLTIMATFTLAGVCENVSYAPLIGPGALFSACVSGELSNIKVPAALNAMKVLEVEPGTEKGNIISTLAVSACTFVTATIAFLGMLFLAPIVAPIFDNPYINPAFTNLVPIIFDAILIPSVLRNLKGTLPIVAFPLVIIFVFGLSFFRSMQGYLILITALISVAYRYLIDKDKFAKNN